MVIDTLQKWYNGHIFGPLTGFFFGKETKEFFQELGDIWIDEKLEKRDFIHNTLYNSIFNRNSTNFVQFILTRRCNIKCPNCNVPLSANYEISLQEWKDIISLLDEHFNPKLISISGGEPLLRYDNLIKIISQCTDKNIPTSLNTNGLLLSTSIIRELRDVGLTLLAVSYDGIKPKSNPKIIDNAILANNLGIDTTLQLTISDKNIHKAYEIKEIAYKNGLGISSLIIQNLNNLFSSDAYAQPNSEFVKEYYSELIND